MLDSYRKAISAGWSDEQFVDLVESLNNAVAKIDGKGFSITPLTRQQRLGAALGLTASLWIKDDTGNVGGSHKARHLFGTMLHLLVDEKSSGDLAIASCGNAALAAAVVAKAARRPIRVFVPTWADRMVVAALKDLDAKVVVSKRTNSTVGDPTVEQMQIAVGKGATPFSVQGPITETALDGGRTIGWELAEQLALARVEGKVHLFVQVGGGALAASAWQGLNDGIREQWLSADPVLNTVQTEAAAPLNRAWRLLRAASEDRVEQAEHARSHPNEYMWAWEEVGSSKATGILDDVTYDWLPVVEAMLASGGHPHVIPESLVDSGHRLAREQTDIAADHTGTAGLAALLDPTIAETFSGSDHVVVFFTGRERNDQQ
ncbi:MAG: pyridoxal-phosphate dependent enzyme [Acidimicrobiia bacterium]